MSVVSRLKRQKGRSASSRRDAFKNAIEALEVRQLFSGLLNLPLLPSPPSPSLGIDGGTASAVGPVGGTKEVTVNSPNNFTANLGGSPTLILPPFLVQIDVQVDSGGNLAGGNPHGGADLLVYQDANNDGAFNSVDGDTLLLQGNVKAFGAGGLREEFVFTPTAGSLLPYFTVPNGIEQVGVQVDLFPTDPMITSLDFNNGFSGDQPKGLLGALPPPAGGRTIPNITTVPGGTVVIGSGVKLTDTATLSGGVNIASGDSITFNLYDPSNNLVDTETVPATANGNYSTPTGYLPTVVGTYQWVATFNGDANNNSVVSKLGDEPETVIPTPPHITTTPGIVNLPGCVCPGQCATIQWWKCSEGNNCILSCNGSSSCTNLGNWLASCYPNLFGSGSNLYCGSLAGKTNAQVCQAYNNLWSCDELHKNTYCQAFATALGIYCDTPSLGQLPTSICQQWGFTSSNCGAATYNCGSNGWAFGCSNNSYCTMSQYLNSCNSNYTPSTGKFCGGDNNKTQCFNNVFCGINTCGNIPGNNCGEGLSNGFKLTDSATLTGAYNPTGSITFYLFAPGVTPNATDSNNVYSDVVTISGSGATPVTVTTATGSNPGGYLPIVNGTYQWIAVYSGDANNNGVSGKLGDEPFTVGKSCPTVVTTPGATVQLGSGVKITDSALLSGGTLETGTITFYLFAPGVTPNGTLSNNVYTDVVTVGGNGTYTTSMGNNPGGYLPSVAGTYQWIANYSGDSKNSAATSNFGEEPECVTPLPGGNICGIKWEDMTGNGFSTDDYSHPLAGITIDLFKVGSAGAKTLLTTTKTKADGTYNFSNVAIGNYYVQEETPSNMAETGGLPGYNVTIGTGAGETMNSTGNNFDNFVEECILSDVTCFYYTIAGCSTQYSTLAGNVHEGDQVTVHFNLQLAASQTSETLSMVSYTAPDAYFVASHASQQVVFDSDTQTFTANGWKTLTVSVPLCYFQVDFVCGPVIDHLGWGDSGSNIMYHAQNRFFDSDNDGCDVCYLGGASLSGFVIDDLNKSNSVNSGDIGIAGAIVRLTGTDCTGRAICLTRVTDANGAYDFCGLKAGCYKLTELTPAGFRDGADLVGTVNGMKDGSVTTNDTIASIVLKFGDVGINYDFLERPAY